MKKLRMLFARPSLSLSYLVDVTIYIAYFTGTDTFSLEIFFSPNTIQSPAKRIILHLTFYVKYDIIPK
jgi:hypothetical protein